MGDRTTGHLVCGFKIHHFGFNCLRIVSGIGIVVAEPFSCRQSFHFVSVGVPGPLLQVLTRQCHRLSFHLERRSPQPSESGCRKCIASVPNSSDGLIYVKRRALVLAKIRALDGRKDGQNSSFARGGVQLRHRAFRALLNFPNSSLML